MGFGSAEVMRPLNHAGQPALDECPWSYCPRGVHALAEQELTR
jgi:hypothetical protein